MCESATTSFGHFSVSFQEHDTFRLHFPSLTTPTFSHSIIAPHCLPEGTGVWIILESPRGGRQSPLIMVGGIISSTYLTLTRGSASGKMSSNCQKWRHSKCFLFTLALRGKFATCVYADSHSCSPCHAPSVLQTYERPRIKNTAGAGQPFSEAQSIPGSLSRGIILMGLRHKV